MNTGWFAAVRRNHGTHFSSTFRGWVADETMAPLGAAKKD